MNTPHNCPFYGCSMIGQLQSQLSLASLILIPTHGNQCAIVFTAHAPCSQEIEGKPVDWRVCPAVAEIRAEFVFSA